MDNEPSKLPLPNELWARDVRFSLQSDVLIMGVLNATPDSFSDGGHYMDPSMALDHVDRMVEEGADLIDIGGESTRPGATAVDEQEEKRRLKPIFEALSRKSKIPLSVDTRKSGVAQVALDLGAVMVNDISALQDDPEMGRVVAKANAGLVLMHMQGSPQTMQRAPVYHDVMEDIHQFFKDRLAVAMDYGVNRRNILLDPGIGFGKNETHNLTIVSRLRQFLDLGRPLMVGVSRKSFIGHIIKKPVEDRCMGTAAAVTVSIMQGAQVIRVHDVHQMKDVATMAKAFQRYGVDDAYE